jgi:hypothetical protein
MATVAVRRRRRRVFVIWREMSREFVAAKKSAA